MLSIKRPTPTTVSYTVSTRSEPRTFTASLTNAISILLRLAAGLVVLLALLHEHQTLFNGTIYHLPPSIHSLLPALPVIATLPPALRICMYALVLWLVFRKGYTSESLLVIRGLGVQTATAGSSFLWGGSTRFIAASAVQDIFIHEAFRRFEVRFYLCIVVEGEESVVVVFPVGDILPVSNTLYPWQMQLTTMEHRAHYLAERFWKRCGGGLELVCTSQSLEHDFMPRYNMLGINPILLLVILFARSDTRIRNSLLRSVPRVHDIRLFCASAFHHRNVRAYRTRCFATSKQTIALH
jgi:phosphatidylinositol glycan class H protein